LPTISALRERADAIVRKALAENEGRWDALSEADRERLELLASTIAKRLLQQPILRLRAREDEHVTYAYVQALRELFGLDDAAGSAFASEAARSKPDRAVEHGAEVTPLRRRATGKKRS
jgi:hypothetical protein